MGEWPSSSITAVGRLANSQSQLFCCGFYPGGAGGSYPLVRWGSNPLAATIFKSPASSLVERRSYKPGARGSIPRRATNSQCEGSVMASTRGCGPLSVGSNPTLHTIL